MRPRGRAQSRRLACSQPSPTLRAAPIASLLRAHARPFAAKIKEFELHALADTAIVKTYPPGGAISRQGDTVSRFRIVRNGCVVESTGKAHYVGDHFGEVELFTKRASEVDVAAETVRGATCLEWSAVHFVAYAAASVRTIRLPIRAQAVLRAGAAR